MGKPLIVVSSVTYAMKGRDILFRHGIRGYVERIPARRKPAVGMEFTFLRERTLQSVF